MKFSNGHLTNQSNTIYAEWLTSLLEPSLLTCTIGLPCKLQVVGRAQGSDCVLVEEWACDSKTMSLLRESIGVIVKISLHRAIVTTYELETIKRKEKMR